MKRLIFIIVIVILSIQYCFSQIPNGFWQEKTSVVSDKLLAGYTFSKNHKFEYSISEYDGLSPYIAFGGHYVIKGCRIYYIVSYIKEKIGGKLCRNHIFMLNDSWAIIGNKVVMRKLIPSAKATELIKIGEKYIILDGFKYYKIDK